MCTTVNEAWVCCVCPPPPLSPHPLCVPALRKGRGIFPLYVACENGYLGIARALLDKGADVGQTTVRAVCCGVHAWCLVLGDWCVGRVGELWWWCKCK